MLISFLALFDVAESVSQAFRSLFGLLCAPVYSLIEIFYDLFSYIARAEILSNSMVDEIYRKLGLILGIFMTFKLIFSLIQSLIDPSKLNDKKNGYASIIFRCLISIVLLGVTPSIFDAAFDLQNTIIGNTDNTSNIIYRLIVEDNSSFDSENFGRKLATELYFSFYRENESTTWKPGVYLTEDNLYVDSYQSLKQRTEAGDVTYLELADKLYEKGDDGNNKYMIEFDGLLCLAVGVFTAYLLLTFCIQTSVKVFQLAYLQLIAPIPIISYISDPEGTFKKWINQCLSTYLDLFIRLAIIYFIVYLSSDIMSKFSPDNVDFASGNTLLDIGIEIFLILGLFLFAKKVPDLIKDLFPNMGGGAGKFSFGLNPKKDLVEPLKPLTSPIGLITRKTIRGVDSAKSGYGFGLGWKSEQGKFEKWKKKMKEQYTPYSYEQSENKSAGSKEVKEIDVKWNKGVDIARELMKNGFGTYGTATGWDKALDGVTRSNYEVIFKHTEFVTSKMNLDKAKKDLDSLRDGLLQVQSGGTFSWRGNTYSATDPTFNAAALSKLYNSQNGMVSGLESVHGSMRKQYADDAKTEDTFKFIKNNSANPAKTSNTHTTKRI